MTAATRYIIKRGTSGWKVHDTSRVVHGIPNLYPAIGRSFLSDKAAAQAEADRLNGLRPVPGYADPIKLTFRSGRTREAVVDGVDQTWPVIAFPAGREKPSRAVFLLQADGTFARTTARADGNLGDIEYAGTWEPLELPAKSDFPVAGDLQ